MHTPFSVKNSNLKKIVIVQLLLGATQPPW